MSDKVSVPPPTAKGTEGYALGLVGNISIEESGLKGRGVASFGRWDGRGDGPTAEHGGGGGGQWVTCSRVF